MAETKKNLGHLRVPTGDDLSACSARDYIHLAPDAARELIPLVAGFLEMLDEVEELPELPPELKYPTRDPGHVPRGPEEDPYNAFT